METYERKKNKITMNDLENEIRPYMEQNHQTILNQIEKSNQALLNALQSMGNSIKNNSSHAKNINSNEPDSNESSSSKIPRPPFLPREEIPREEEQIDQPSNSIVDNARAYASLEPEIRELITFA